MIRRLWFFWTLVWIGVGGIRAEELPRVDVSPVWNGWYKAGKMTEAQVRLLAQKGGDYKISTGILSAVVRLEADIPESIWLPLRPDASGAIELSIYNPAEPDSVGTSSRLLSASGDPHIIIVTDGLPVDAHEMIANNMRLSDKEIFMSISAAELPRFGASYESVDAVVMQFAGLKNLQDRQIQALSHYLMRCGSMIALSFPDSIFNRLKQLSGCQGRFLTSFSSPGQVPKRMPAHEKSALPALASLEDSKTLLEIDRPNSWVVIFCLGYLLVGFITVGISSRRRILLILPLISAMAAILVWGHRRPEKFLTSWLEMDAGHTSAQYSAYLTLQGAGIWREQLELPGESDCPLSHSKQERLLNADKDSIVSSVKYALLSGYTCHWQSVMPLAAPLSLAVEENRPTVFNHGEFPTEQGLLRWRGGIYAIPPLQSGQKWVYSPAAGKADYSGIAEVFARQSRLDEVALLIPFTPKILSTAVTQRGWLLIHGGGTGV